MVVKSYIESAGPVGSAALKNRFDLGMISATIRNEMSELEKLGLLGHPFTSSGRVPTKLGYQAFVSELMEAAVLSDQDRMVMERELMSATQDTQTLIRESSRILSRLARLLGVVLSPKMSEGVLQRLEIVQVASDTVMFVISVRGGFIRTILMQIDSELRKDQLDALVSLLNERLAGLTLDEIRRTCLPRFQDLTDEETGLVQLIVDRSTDLFSETPSSGTIQMDGTTYILSEPEFSEMAPVKELIELLDDESSITQIVEQSLEQVAGVAGTGIARIRIGCESSHPSSGRLSIVSAPFVRSNLRGTIGLIGPTRMNYARAVALVEGISTLMSVPGTSEHLA